MSVVMPLDLGHGADIDVDEAWWLIGRDTLTSVGAHERAWSNDHVAFFVRGSHRPHRRIYIQRWTDDTYNVGIGYIDPNAYDWIWELTEFGICNDALSNRVMAFCKECA